MFVTGGRYEEYVPVTNSPLVRSEEQSDHDESRRTEKPRGSLRSRCMFSPQQSHCFEDCRLIVDWGGLQVLCFSSVQ